MKKLTPPPPFYSAPDNERWEFFWYWIRENFQGGHNQQNHFEVLINHLFREGNIYGILKDVPYDAFAHMVRVVQNSRYTDYHRRPGHWYYSHGVDFREPMAYVRRPHHEKKVLSEQEQARREWRDKKQFKKDKSRRHYRTYRTWAKKYSNKYHRAYQRQCLAHGDYDELTELLDKTFKNKWMWD